MFFKKKKRLDNNEWVILSDSITGKSHKIKNPPIPCQDSNFVKVINSNWGIAIVSDGLGSKKLSHIGSKFIAKTTALILAKLIAQEKWIEQNKLPSTKEWAYLSHKLLFKIYKLIKVFAKRKNYNINDLASTLIAVVYSPHGLLITHMGDGRAGYCNTKGIWKSMMTPINGETSNQVMPITANIWTNKKTIEKYTESNVIKEPIKAFILMSDGCEYFSYRTNQYDKSIQKYKDINLPYENFFNPILKYFSKKIKLNTPLKDIQKEWSNFLDNGNEVIANEPDDKTMIFAFKKD